MTAFETIVVAGYSLLYFAFRDAKLTDIDSACMSLILTLIGMIVFLL